MPFPQLNRADVRMKPLASRENKKRLDRDRVSPDEAPSSLSNQAKDTIDEAVARIRSARSAGRPVIMAFGAHTVKNGLGPVLIRLLENDWLTLLATNGAGIIHDWEFAFQGRSSEDVKGGVARGEFGNWWETGYYINLAINVGAYEGKGYGESVGSLIEGEGLAIPDASTLERAAREQASRDPAGAAAAMDMLATIRKHKLNAGWLPVKHEWKAHSIQAAAERLRIPFTGHPMFGHDIIYNHPMNCGAAIGRTAERDFLTFARQVCDLDGGVYISLGSAVMSPMIFEKSMSMAQNLAIQQNRRIENHYVLVVDLAESRWDWTKGEPPETHPDYYLRFNKTFSRTGGTMRYITAHNRDFLLALWHGLKDRVPQP